VNTPRNPEDPYRGDPYQSSSDPYRNAAQGPYQGQPGAYDGPRSYEESQSGVYVGLRRTGQGSGSHRRRKKGGGGRIAIAGAVVGVIAIAGIVGGIVLSRSGSGSGSTPGGSQALPGAAATVGGDFKQVPKPTTGTALNVATPDGYGYSVAAIKGGTSDQPLIKSVSAEPSGQTFAYVDYLLTNTTSKPALLDFPADLFIQQAKVPKAAQPNCMPQPGVPGTMCTLRNHSLVINIVQGSKPPATQSGDQYIPPGSAYVIRLQTDVPVDKGLSQGDMGVYIWDARFISDRKAVNVPFP
jgi:hypothetical protein